MKKLKVIYDTDLMYDVDTLMVYPVEQLNCCNLTNGVPMKDLPSGTKEKCIESYITNLLGGRLFNDMEIKVIQK